MKKRDYLLLYGISVLFYLGLLFVQQSPAYFDAKYYYAEGIQLAKGSGFYEPYLWNYLNAPAQLPNAAFLYWMPLASLVASLGMIVFGSTSYLTAMVPFVLLAGFVPVLTAYLAVRLSTVKFAGWFAGALAIIGGYFLPFVTQIDTHYLYMLGGGIFFVFLLKIWSDEGTWIKTRTGFLLLGCLAGLMHLARADGILWLLGALGIVWIPWIFRKVKFSGEVLRIKQSIFRSGMIIAGYAAIMGAWYVRNLQLFGSWMPPDNSRNLFLTQYNDLFSFPSSILTFNHWIASGLENIVSARLISLGMNLETLIAVSGGIILIVFMILGFVVQRKSRWIIYLLFMLVFEVGVMSFVFPYAGERGGLFHSVSAFQPVLYALVPVGLNTAIEFGVQKRRWQSARSWKMFGGAVLVVFALISGFVFITKVNALRATGVLWDQGRSDYQAINEKLVSLSGDALSTVMVVDPVGYYLDSGRTAIVTPQGSLDQVRAAAQAYTVRFLILDSRLTKGLQPLYDGKSSPAGFSLIGSLNDVKFYQVEP